MRLILSALMAVTLLVACARGPLKVVEERRFYPNIFSGFSDRVVTESNLASDGTSLYFGTREGVVYALDGHSGNEKWNVSLEGSIDSQLHADGKRLYVGTSAGHFYALSSEKGEKVWQQNVSGEIIGQPTGVGEDMVLFGANDGVLYAADAKTGEIRWRYRSDLPDRIGIHGFARPLVRDQKVYAALADGSVALLRANDGTEISRQSMQGRVRFPEVVAPLIASDGQVLAAQFFGSLHLLGPDGAPRWSVASGGTGSAPIVSGKVIFTGGAANQIMALDPANGERKWVHDVGESANWSGLVLDGGRLIAATHEGRIYVLNPEDGKLIWTYDVTGSIPAAPVAVAGKIWVLTNRGQVLGFTLTN